MSDLTVWIAEKKGRAEVRRREVKFIPQPVALCLYCTGLTDKCSRAGEKTVMFTATGGDIWLGNVPK